MEKKSRQIEQVFRRQDEKSRQKKKYGLRKKEIPPDGKEIPSN